MQLRFGLGGGLHEVEVVGEGGTMVLANAGGGHAAVLEDGDGEGSGKLWPKWNYISVLYKKNKMKTQFYLVNFQVCNKNVFLLYFVFPLHKCE